ncbi:MAG: glucose-6-phosphate dehydrogenase [Gammaproteobacteria bacterium]|nr:glucose-6-phosphate dehydrogenase [Gammaproteobacteria bacterium]MCW8987032.1 glucose-6-phosphate dehydrogenase [Gammaproteobacteria bacterium]MCW9031532.1 glucose-6-phosphate dehydrogenase [Gammaproteobacteria bacterium]
MENLASNSESVSTAMDKECIGKQTDPTNIVIFGAGGDLTKRKLIPALVKMLRCGLLHQESKIIGVLKGRSLDEWLASLKEGISEYAKDVDVNNEQWKNFSAMFKMVDGDLADDATYQLLDAALENLNGFTHAMFYCAVPPRMYTTIAAGLHKQGLSDQTKGFRRVVIEKPFGMDLKSSKQLNQELQELLSETQIYRIDHYLGKESVQNLLVYRFANTILEPLWNRNYVDHIQISAAEDIGIGYRANYYEKSGALRDMIQSHLMQVMTLVAMEPPVEFTAKAVRDEKIKVLRAVRHFEKDTVKKETVAAQYSSGTIGDAKIKAYVAEEGVSADSVTETFSAARFYIDNWRWQGVPFILWTGKRLPKRVSEIVIRFRKLPFNLFDTHATPPIANSLVFRLHPDEGIFLRMNAKMPGLTTDTQRMVMRAPYSEDGQDVSDAYEVLLHDVLTGDATLFSRADEVEESWSIIEPILDVWKDRISIDRYRAGSWDVPGMDELFTDCVGGWHKPS